MSSPRATVLREGVSVTAIIPTYNRANYLRTAIFSVLAQSFPPAQIIVVDDGSKDNTREIVAEFAAPVEYIAKENGGKSSALNFGLRHARGKLIWIFDDDDLAEPDALRKLVSALQENPACGFAYGDYDIFTIDAGGKMRKIPVGFPAVRSEDLYLALMERSFILQQGILVRKGCYDEVGSFNETLIRSQDLDMMLKLARRCMGVKVEGITFHLRQHAADALAEGPVNADCYNMNLKTIFVKIFDASRASGSQSCLNVPQRRTIRETARNRASILQPRIRESPSASGCTSPTA